MSDQLFVPEDFAVPAGLTVEEFRLEPLGPEHNAADYASWTASIDHIRATPGFPWGSWPHQMSLAENLRDLERHADDFAGRRGFTYTVLSVPAGDVIGCVYIYPPPGQSPGHPGADGQPAAVRSWVRADRAALDPVLYRAVRAWLERDWPFGSIEYAPRDLPGARLPGLARADRHGMARGMRSASHWLLAGMRIAVIGRGNIGGTLGSKWRRAGHDVVYGARDGSGQSPDGAPVRSIGDALEDAEVVLLAVPGQAVPDVVSEQGPALAGKVVIDAVNRMGAPEFDSRALIAAAAPSARYVRAFNSLGWENLADPLPGTNLFFAADPEARVLAEELISAVGLEPAYLGDATATATVDVLLPLWFALVRQNGGDRKVALRIVR